MKPESKFNYEKGFEFLKEIADTTGTTTREDIMIAMFGSVVDKNNAQPFSAALNNLKTKRLRKYGIDLIREKNGTYTVKYISQDSNESEDVQQNTYKPVKTGVVKNSVLEALEKDNQKLYLEREQLKLKYQELENQYTLSLSKEKEYKNIIESLYKLLSI